MSHRTAFARIDQKPTHPSCAVLRFDDALAAEADLHIITHPGAAEAGWDTQTPPSA